MSSQRKIESKVKTEPETPVLECKPFAQVPLSAILVFDQVDEFRRFNLFDFFVFYGIGKISEWVRKKVPGIEADAEADWWVEHMETMEMVRPEMGEVDLRDSRHREIVLAYHSTNLRGAVEGVLRCHDFTNDTLRKNNLEVGQPYFRIRLDRLLRWRDEEDFRETDLRVLAAVDSCLGQKRFTQIRQAGIALRAVGVKSKTSLKRLEEQLEGIEPLTIPTVKHSLNKLEKKNFFSRVIVANRFTRIGRMPQPALRKAVEKELQEREGKRRKVEHLPLKGGCEND